MQWFALPQSVCYQESFRGKRTQLLSVILDLSLRRASFRVIVQAGLSFGLSHFLNWINGSAKRGNRARDLSQGR